MNRNARWFAPIALIFLMMATLNVSALPAGKQTLTGEVSDAMCGKKHMADEGTPAQCTRACVAHGSKYALIVGEKVYVLDATDKAALDTLDKQAGKNATVTGVVNADDTVTVSSVMAK